MSFNFTRLDFFHMYEQKLVLNCFGTEICTKKFKVRKKFGPKKIKAKEYWILKSQRAVISLKHCTCKVLTDTFLLQKTYRCCTTSPTLVSKARAGRPVFRARAGRPVFRVRAGTVLDLALQWRAQQRRSLPRV